MKIQSPLSNLSDVFIQAKQSATQYRTTLVKNEAATRAVLIDPILRALGWEIANTDMVEVEKAFGQMRADYALFDENGDVKVLLEAKSLDEQLDTNKILISLISYALTFGIDDVFLTDGNIWKHYSDFSTKPIIPTKIIDIANDSPTECAAYFVHVLDAARYWAKGPTIDVLQQEIDQLKNDLSSANSDLQKEVTAIKILLQQAGVLPMIAAQHQSTTTQTASVQYTDVDAKVDYTDTKPSRLKLPNGSEIDVTSWKEVLRETCKFAMGLNRQLSVPLPDASGRKVSLLSAKPSRPQHLLC